MFVLCHDTWNPEFSLSDIEMEYGRNWPDVVIDEWPFSTHRGQWEGLSAMTAQGRAAVERLPWLLLIVLCRL